jgi:oligoribonuclease NrnB/cAMP/cGMP phosphodiesterase (DHH superfamily)
LILTHESDLDGLLSGVLLRRLAQKVFGTPVRMEAYHYNPWRQRELRESSAWVADFTFEARLDKPNWMVVDHHPTETPAQQATLIHDTTKAAASLCYELCLEHGLGSPELDRLVHLNNVADLFLEDDPDFVLAGDYANLVKHYQFWNLHDLIQGRIESLLDHPLLEVMAVKRRVEDPLGLAWSRQNIKELATGVGFVDTVIGNNNLIVHQLLEQQTAGCPVLVTLFRRSTGVIIASFRSRNGEALKVAAKFQGGGHPNACGATLPRSVRTIPDAVDYLRQTLNPKRNDQLNSLESVFASLEGPGR